MQGGTQTSAQLRRLGISSASALPCSMLIQHRFAFLNLRPSLRIDESQEELSIPQALDCKQKLFPSLANGGPPGAIQRRGVDRRNGEIPNAATESGVPGVSFTPFMFFMVKCICLSSVCSASSVVKLYWRFFVVKVY